MEFISRIAQSGIRVLDFEDLFQIANTLNISPKYMRIMMSKLVKKKLMVSLGKGLYTLPIELLAGGPIHSFEIAMKLAKKGAISYRSALFHYQLSDQLSSKIYVTIPKEEGANLSKIKEYHLQGVSYHFIRTTPQLYWGIKPLFLGEAKVFITDLEKTLIDGLSHPQYCGGFREVLAAYEKGVRLASPDLLGEYALKTSLIVCKRLGWVLEKLKLHPKIITRMKALPMPYYQKLDPQGERKGKTNPHWNLIENI